MTSATAFELPPSLWSTLRLLTFSEPWPPSAVGAERFVAEAARQEILPLLCIEPGLPDTIRTSLDARRMDLRLNEARTALRIEVQRKLCTILAEEPLLFLKGADFMHRLYPRPPLRAMKDIDLLVRPDRMSVVCKRLEDHGALPCFPGSAATRVATHHERAFLLDEVLVEVHQFFIQRPRHRIDYPGIWARRVPLEVARVRAARLSDADALAYQALSMAIDQFVVPLMRCVDFWCLSRVAPGVLGAAAMRAREWRSRHAFYGALRHTARAFPEFLTAEAEAAMACVVTARERRFLDRWALPQRLPTGQDPRSLTRLWRKFWLMDAMDRRIAFLVSHARASASGRLAARRER